MAKSVNVGYTDTPISGVSSLNFSRGLLNFKADFRMKSNNAGEVVLTNLTSPVDRPEKIRLGYSEVANIYTNTNIDPSVYAPTKQGISVVCQVSEVFSVTDSVDADYRVDLPVSAHLVLKLPSSEFITADMVQTMLGRMISGMYETGSLNTSRIAAILRGSLLPSDL